jgi:hypothetical protein
MTCESQRQYIEHVILGGKFVLKLNPTSLNREKVEANVGNKLEEFLKGLPLPEGFFPREEILEKEDDQPMLPRRTRANAPFLPSVEPHRSIPKNKMIFSKESKEAIEFVLTNRYTSDLPIRNAIYQKLKQLSNVPGQNSMPGPVHNATTKTCLEMANLLKMNPTNSVWADFGSGGIKFGISGSIFNQETWCLDLPNVITLIEENLDLLDLQQKEMVMPLHFISGNCCRLDATSYPKEFYETSHLTIFIGIRGGNSA